MPCAKTPSLVIRSGFGIGMDMECLGSINVFSRSSPGAVLSIILLWVAGPTASKRLGIQFQYLPLRY